MEVLSESTGRHVLVPQVRGGKGDGGLWCQLQHVMFSYILQKETVKTELGGVMFLYLRLKEAAEKVVCDKEYDTSCSRTLGQRRRRRRRSVAPSTRRHILVPHAGGGGGDGHWRRHVLVPQIGGGRGESGP